MGYEAVDSRRISNFRPDSDIDRKLPQGFVNQFFIIFG
jgi:hypothetical protein